MSNFNPAEDFDLQPDPRILPMLGEINLPQWRCIAELIDNSIDGFLQAKRAGASIECPEVMISIPKTDNANVRITVKDNGPGMDPKTLETAVRAGWTGNNPIDSLGMFGMGFNIATARLGTVTTVWTTEKGSQEWHGLEINFDQLRRQKHYKTKHLTKLKTDLHQQGTVITIEKLKPEQRTWFSKTMNRSRVKKELSKSYSAMLRPNGVPINFTLKINGREVSPNNYCVWDEQRQVDTSRHGTVQAVYQINTSMDSRPFCMSCWSWLSFDEDNCTSCAENSKVVSRERKVHGWIGLQRFLSKNSYGIDLIRNGRKIETSNKDLFIWREGDDEELEYPIDDPRNRGRIVGEIHLDHCRVTYTKDRFERTDPAFDEMVKVVRGEGPLRPDKAQELGYGVNQSPLFLLFQAFRRSTPKSKVAGSWAKLLVVKDNERAEQMADKFSSGDSAYLEDTKWWELVKEEDRKLLLQNPSVVQSDFSDDLPLFGDKENESDENIMENKTEDKNKPSTTETREPIHSLTQEYRHDGTNLTWDVRAWSAEVVEGPGLEHPPSLPWSLKRQPLGVFDFVVYLSHEIFDSATMTPLDGLLAELASSAMDFHRGSKFESDITFSQILSDLRRRYAGTYRLEPKTLIHEAGLTITYIARSVSQQIDEENGIILYNELSPTCRKRILKRRASRRSKDTNSISTHFLEYADHETVLKFFSKHPDLFFDGKFWSERFIDIDYGLESVNDDARAQILRYYEGLLADAIWLAGHDPEELNQVGKTRLIRAALALELLKPEFSLGE